MFSHLYMVCLRQSQHWEASCRKQTSVERKTEPMEILKKKQNKKNQVPLQYRHPCADTDRRLSQAASFITVEHETGRGTQLCQPEPPHTAVRPRPHIHSTIKRRCPLSYFGEYNFICCFAVKSFYSTMLEHLRFEKEGVSPESQSVRATLRKLCSFFCELNPSLRKKWSRNWI